MTHSAIPKLLKSAIAAGALLGLGGCMYGGTGYYGDGYVNNSRYDCDPYAPFDDYYACDYGYGFANIGYGGGWYDQYYYPGYGVYVFDRGGRRHAMRAHDRRYWARQRAAMALGTADAAATATMIIATAGVRGRESRDRTAVARPVRTGTVVTGPTVLTAARRVQSSSRKPGRRSPGPLRSDRRVRKADAPHLE